MALVQAPSLGIEGFAHDSNKKNWSRASRQDYDAEIDSYIDSPESQERQGTDVVPWLHGWNYSASPQGQQFSWLMLLGGGAAGSLKGDRAGTRFGGESVCQANLAQGGATITATGLVNNAAGAASQWQVLGVSVN